MVVDDDEMMRDLTVTALSYCVNRKVESFDSPQNALAYMNQGGRIDIIITDVDMPDMEGMQFMRKVKEKDPTKVFIAMSGNAQNENLSQLFGATAFLAKPIDINDLFDIVQHYVVDPV